MLENTVDRVVGQINGRIHARAVKRLPDLVNDLLQEAIKSWAAHGWHTFDRTEDNCSCQLFRWLLDTVRSHPRFSVLDVNFQHVQLTPEMLSGNTSVVAAGRPDLRISVRGRGVLLEAKRLSATPSLCRAYVDDGMARFVSAKYGADDGWGMMVGYVNGSSNSNVRSRVNTYVRRHPIMGVSHELGNSIIHTNGEWLRSSHHRSSGLSITLDHVWVRLP